MNFSRGGGADFDSGAQFDRLVYSKKHGKADREGLTLTGFCGGDAFLQVFDGCLVAMMG